MNNGWIKLHRCLMEKAIWKCSSPEHKAILITLLMMANHEEKQWLWKGEKYICKPGQFITSLKTISENSGTSIQNVRTALTNFQEKYDFLTNESTKQNRLISINNWDTYQGKESKPNKENNNQLTNDQQTANKQLTTNKNDKECKERKEEIPANKFADDSIEIQLSKHLFSLIQDRNPKAKKPDFQKWAEHIDFMIRLDDRTVSEITDAIDWCQNDDFWFSNILSTKTLRKQYDKLYAAAQREKINGQPKRYINNLKACQEFIDERF